MPMCEQFRPIGSMKDRLPPFGSRIPEDPPFLAARREFRPIRYAVPGTPIRLD